MTFPHGDSKTFTYSSRSYILQLQIFTNHSVCHPAFACNGGNASHRAMTTLHPVTTDYSNYTKQQQHLHLTMRCLDGGFLEKFFEGGVRNFWGWGNKSLAPKVQLTHLKMLVKHSNTAITFNSSLWFFSIWKLHHQNFKFTIAYPFIGIPSYALASSI